MLAQGSNTARVLRTLANTPRIGAETPNHSLNRTLHSVPLFVPAKTLAQIPSHCSGPVSSNVRPLSHLFPQLEREAIQ